MKKGLDRSFVECCLSFIRREDLNPVRPLGRLGRANDDHSICPGLPCRSSLRIKPDNNLVAAIAQVLRLGMSLAAVTQDGNGFALQGAGVSIAFVKNLGGH